MTFPIADLRIYARSNGGGLQMGSKIPRSLQLLIDSRADPASDRAWAEFLNDYSKLILHVARATDATHDTVMDRYLFVLDALRANDFRRLRAYSEDGRGSFTTWLVAVTRRLCVDEHRRRYGRPQGAGNDLQVTERANLVDLLNSVESLDALESSVIGPDGELEALEIESAVDCALSELPVPDRLLIRLRFEDGLPVPEIAALLGETSPFRTYRRIDRILERLRRALDESGIERSIP